MKRHARWFARHARWLWRAAMQWQTHNGNLLAAATAYYAMLSILPLLLVLVSLLGFVFQFSDELQDAQTGLLDLVAQRTSLRLAEWLGGILTEVRNRATIGGPLGLVTLLMAAIGIFAQFEKAFDTIWSVEAPESQGILGAIRNALWSRLRAFVMLTVLGTAVVSVLLMELALAVALKWLPDLPGGPWLEFLLHMPAGLLLNWVLFALLFKFVPKRPVRWPEAARGALLAGVLWEIARYALSFGLRTSRYGAYGVIGAVIIFMLWVYAGAAIAFFGAEYVHVLGRERKT